MKPPSTVVTTTVVLPTAIPVTAPDSLTTATFSFSEDQTTLLSSAFEGTTVAVRVFDSPTSRLSSFRSSDTPATSTPSCTGSVQENAAAHIAHADIKSNSLLIIR